MTLPTIGTSIKDFELSATSNRTIKLSDLRGKNVVLYFYPKDSTPGCTREGQDFRDLHEKFMQANTLVLGVSRDSLKAHEKFKEKQCFPFELLSDPENKLCQYFGVLKEKNMFGKKVFGIERSTFLIDKAGNLVREWRKVDVFGHADEVLQA